MMQVASRPCVLVFAGLDSSGGAGLQADIEAIASTGSHALPIATALTVQDNDQVYAVNPVSSAIVRRQAEVLIQKISISAVKIGIVGNRDNAEVIADIIRQLRLRQPELPVVLDTVLGSQHGQVLSEGKAEHALQPLLSLATLVTPNLPEVQRLAPALPTQEARAALLLKQGAAHVLIKGGHGEQADLVENSWYTAGQTQRWQWKRLNAEFHGSGCTLASVIAGLLAQGMPMAEALTQAQERCQRMFGSAFAISTGQLIPNRQA